jgi:hypothetical protein
MAEEFKFDTSGGSDQTELKKKLEQAKEAERQSQLLLEMQTRVMNLKKDRVVKLAKDFAGNNLLDNVGDYQIKLTEFDLSKLDKGNKEDIIARIEGANKALKYELGRLKKKADSEANKQVVTKAAAANNAKNSAATAATGNNSSAPATTKISTPLTAPTPTPTPTPTPAPTPVVNPAIATNLATATAPAQAPIPSSVSNAAPKAAMTSPFGNIDFKDSTEKEYAQDSSLGETIPLSEAEARESFDLENTKENLVKNKEIIDSETKNQTDLDELERQKLEKIKAANISLGDEVSFTKEEALNRFDLEGSLKESGDAEVKNFENFTGEKKTEQLQNIEKFKKEKDEALREFLEEDYKKKKAWNRLGDYFKSVFRNKEETGKNFERDADIAHFEAVYEDRLREYKKAVLENAGENLSDKELTDLVTEFEIENRINKAEVHDEIKHEHLDGKVRGLMDKMAAEYRSLPTWKKLLIGAGFAGAAVGAANIGTAAVVAVATAATARRVFMGMVTGVGTAKWLESRTEKNRETEVGEMESEFLKELQGKTPEEKFDLLNSRLNKVILDEDRSINQIKNKNLFNLTAATAVGTFVGAGGIGKMAHLAGEGLSWIKGGLFDLIAEDSKNVAPGAENLKNLIELKVEDGEGFEQTVVEEYLDQHRDEFLRIHPDLENFSNGQIAHRLAIDFTAKHPEMQGHLPDLIHSGSKLVLNPNSLQIEIHDPQGYGWYEGSGNNEPHLESVENQEAAPDAPEASESSNQIKESGLDSEEVKEIANEEIQKHVQAEDAVKAEKVEVVQKEFVQAKEDYSKAASNALESNEPTMEQYDAMQQADNAAKVNYEYIKNNTNFIPDIAKQATTISKQIAGGSRAFWLENQDLEYDRAVADDTMGPRLKALREQFEKEIGKKGAFSPKDDETLKQWAKRVATKIMEKRYGIAN